MPIMVPHGAAVRAVRKGKRVKIQVGQAFDFTEDEIASVNKSVPGALRKPVNEVVPVAAPAAEKPAKGKKAKAAKPAKAEGEEDADEDEDEDI
jgi:hypothetical protein